MIQSPTDEYVGRKFGIRTVISRTDDDTRGYPRYLIECECGKVSRISERSLATGKCLTCKSCAPHLNGDGHRNWQGGYKNKGSVAWANSRLKSGKKAADKFGHAPPIGDTKKVITLWTECNGKCLLCGSQRRLCLDHDHHNYLTCNLRGFLCTACNHAVGLIKDNPVVAIAMAGYLDKAHARRQAGILRTPVTDETRL